MAYRLLSVIALVACLPLYLNGQGTDVARDRQRAVLNDAGVIHIRLEAIVPDAPSTARDQLARFKGSDKIKFSVVVTNNSSTPVRAPISNTFIQDRPALLKEGSVVLKYKPDVDRLLAASEESEPNSLRRDSVVLTPGQEKIVEVIDLANWFRPLRPGSYQLTIKHRFEWGGTWIESASVSFEVEN
jgi:hypothetical protein